MYLAIRHDVLFCKVICRRLTLAAQPPHQPTHEGGNVQSRDSPDMHAVIIYEGCRNQKHILWGMNAYR